VAVIICTVKGSNHCGEFGVIFKPGVGPDTPVELSTPALKTAAHCCFNSELQALLIVI